MKKILILFSIIICLFTANVSALCEAQDADIGWFKTGASIELWQTCPDCSFVNISKISYPNSSNAISNIAMVKTGTYYNTSFSLTTTNGIYVYRTFGNSSTNGICTQNIKFHINPTGEEPEISRAILYWLLTVAIFIIFAFFLYASIVIPYSNEVDQKGNVINVTRKKYIKMGFILITYQLLLWLLNTLVGLSYNYLDISLFYGFVSWAFLIANRLNLWFAVFILVVSIFEIIRDANLTKHLEETMRAFK